MRIPAGLDDLFARGSHIRVLRALDALPRGVGASGREIARRAGVSAPTAREALESLVDQGVVDVRRSLKNAAYRLNGEHALFGLIRQLFERETALSRELETDVGSALAKHRGIREAILFGSAARGDMTPRSDIDVAIRGASDVPEDEPSFDRIHRKYGNRVNVVHLRTRVGRGLQERIRVEGKPLPLPRTRG